MRAYDRSAAVTFKVALATALTLLTFGKIVWAAELPMPGEKLTPEQAYQHLLSAEFFAFGPVFLGGITSDGERAFRAILTSTNALQLFRAASTHTNAVANLYALCGIRKLAPATFDAQAKRLIAANPEVIHMAGCKRSQLHAKYLVEWIASGSYDNFLKISNP